MAQIYCTGAVHIYVGTKGAGGGAGVPKYLGTGRVAPESNVRREYEPVMNDVGGSKIPIEMLSEGRQATTVVDLTRWNQNVINALEEIRSNGNAALGTDLNGDIGAAMILEGYSYATWLVYPFSNKVAYQNVASGAMPKGVKFLASWGTEFIRRGGTKANEYHISLQHLPIYDGKTGSMKLYTYDIAEVAGIPFE